MEALFYKVLVFLSRCFGPWFFTLVSGGIAAGCLICCPGRVAVGMKFHRALYPHRGRWHAVRCTWRQFRQFTTVFMDRGDRSPFDLVTGRQFVGGGGVVSMTGDRLWHSDQRSAPVHFLGHEALLPEVPYQFARLSGAPLIAFFASRRGRGRYHFSFSAPIHVTAPDRAARADAIARAVQAYADLLAAAVRSSPYEWHHFQPFLGKRISTAL